MKKKLLVAFMLVFGFAGVSNADLLYKDPNSHLIPDGGSYSWDNVYIGSVSSAELSMWFVDDGFDLPFFEIAQVTIEGSQSDRFQAVFNFKEFNVTGYLNDGYLSWTVASLKGDFWVKGVEINANPVPEPASMILFGTGLVVFGFAGRKFKTK